MPAPRVIFHLDMDAFYASVEQRDHPEMRGKPVIVGSPPDRRGVVCAASYEARVFGVRSAMPSMTAGRLCPDGVFVRPRMDVYRDESRAIMAIVGSFAGELVQQVSVDEAYLEVSSKVPEGEADTMLEAALPLAREIKAAIKDQRGLTATIGVAPNKLLAKIASSNFKPDGLTLVKESDKAAFMRSLPIGAIHGVGKVTEQMLVKAGLKTVADMQDFSGDLRAYVGSWGPQLKRMAFGEDDRALDLGDDIKSVSSENTFLQDTAHRPTLRACLLEQAEDIAKKLQKRRLAARTVQVKVRYSDFTTLTRQISVEEPIDDQRTIYRFGCWLLGRHELVKRPLRLLGLGVAGLGEVTIKQMVLPFEG
ncbi:MAG: polymerase [Verrucomicrobiaceae bacterium]|nr:polymerase [Verrucomicrobiaceae bacterium]MDB6118802.1 polymerase [Verrucomicrobiaceae bacterium]